MTQAAADLKEETQALIASDLGPVQLRGALQALHERWLADLAASVGVGPGSGFALVAVGALGRGEFLPHSDLDLVLLHCDRPADEVQVVAEGLWYPIWDARISLDHSVRTEEDLSVVVEADLRAALSLLRRRLIAGDEDLYRRATDLVLQSWRRRARQRLPELITSARARWTRFGSVAHRAEPDLKSGKGGMRDAHLLDALALAQLTDGTGLASTAGGLAALTDDSPGGDFVRSYMQLLDVRTQLRRVTGRGHDQLQAQDADEVAATLGVGDRFDLARTLSGVGRVVEYCVDVGLRVAQNAAAAPEARRAQRRRPLGEGVVAHGGEVALAKDARPDLGLLLRVAAASAVSGLPISQATLGRLAAADLDQPWTTQTRHNLLVVLGARERAVRVVETLDRTGLWGRLFPEWAAVRDLPPRDSIHVWTVDRHLMETVARASALTTRVSRPDLLLLAALLHDLGKGQQEDHSVVGERLVRQIGPRLGLAPSDVDVLAAVVRHHLLLPTIATRRDVRDCATADLVLDELDGNLVVLELLAALAEADSRATGPGVWGDWKAGLIAGLVANCRRRAGGAAAPPSPEDDVVSLLDRAAESLKAARAAEQLAGQVVVQWSSTEEAQFHELIVVAPDTVGLMAKATAVLALHGLRCHRAELVGSHGFAVGAFVVSPRFGEPVAAPILRQDLLRSLEGSLDVGAALAAKELGRQEPLTTAEVGVPVAPKTAEPRVLWLGGSDRGALVEVRGADGIGLLARLTAVFAESGLSVLEARVQTLGLSVVDVFTLPADQISAELRKQLDTELVAALSPL